MRTANRLPLPLLLTASLLFISSPAFTADLSITATPENGDAATENDFADAYTLTTTTPGLSAYSFSATWDELSNPEANRITELKIAAHFGGEAKLPGYLGLNVVHGTLRSAPKEFRRTRWTSPEILVALDALLRNMQTTTGSNVKWFTLGHQADLYFTENPDELEDFLTFYKTALATVRRLYPVAKIGIAVTQDGLTGPRKAIADQLVAASDAAFISYAPVTPDFKAKDEAAMDADLKALLETQFNKPIVLLDLFYPTSRKADGSEKAQDRFLKKYIPQLKAAPSVELVNLSTLHDISPDQCKDLQSQYGMKSRDFSAAYCSSGFIEIDGKEKSSWKVIRQTVKPDPTSTQQESPH